MCYEIGLSDLAHSMIAALSSNSWRIDNNPGVARFLTPEERKWAVERLRDNNTGVESSEYQLDKSQRLSMQSLIAACPQKTSNGSKSWRPCYLLRCGFLLRSPFVSSEFFCIVSQ